MKRFGMIFAAVLLCMGLAAWLYPAATTALAAESYGLYVGGVEVTSENCGSITGNGISGTVSYDPNKDELTLNGATISSTYVDDVGTCNIVNTGLYKQLKLVLIGNNILKDGQFGIFLYNGAIFFQGTGNLSVTSSVDGIHTSSDIMVDGPTIEVSGGFNNIFCGDLFIQKARLHVIQIMKTK